MNRNLQKMKLSRMIPILLQPILIILCCEASSLFHLLPASSSSPHWSTSRRRRRRSHQGAFINVPRGGSSNDADATFSEPEVPADGELQNVDSNIEKVDDDGTDIIITDDYYLTSCENGEEEEDHDNLPASIDPNILSPTHLTFLFSSAAHHGQSFTSAMVHYASLLLRATRRACLAGARAAVTSMNNDDDDEDRKERSRSGVSRESASEVRRAGGGGKKPMVHTLIGRTVHVLGEMYHAALTSDDDGLDVGDKRREEKDEEKLPNCDEEEAGIGRKRSRRRRRHRHHHSEKKRRHRHHQQYLDISTPPKAMKVISNGGGMEPSPPSPPSHSHHDAILQLAELYNMKLPTSDDKAHRPSLPNKYESILLSTQTPINEALQMANSNARFLLCYISKQNNKRNAIAIPNLLSPEIIKLANRKALGKKQIGEYASFYIWIANDDAHVDAAMKRLGVKPPKRQSSTKKPSSKPNADAPPILAIIYPATTIDPSSGRPRISSRVLAQHHCNPPPTTTEMLTSWANSVRRRHLREYAKLQHACTELQFLKERNRGYVGSIQGDEAREAKERKLRQQKEVEEAHERDRLRPIEERRQILLESLVEEPPVSTTPPEDVITIALRFIDGSNKRDQRRFLADKTTLNGVCNWIDATHGIEREKLELSTMNGARKFMYADNDEDDLTLREAGLAKMTALRVALVEAVVENTQGNEIVVNEGDEEVEEQKEDDDDAEEEDDDEGENDTEEE